MKTKSKTLEQISFSLKPGIRQLCLLSPCLFVRQDTKIKKKKHKLRGMERNKQNCRSKMLMNVRVKVKIIILDIMKLRKFVEY